MEGKKCIVTGGAQGLSKGMAEGLWKWAEVVLVDVQEEKLKQVVEHYRSLGYKAYGIAGNLADREELGRIFDQALEVLGGKEKFCWLYLFQGAGRLGCECIL